MTQGNGEDLVDDDEIRPAPSTPKPEPQETASTPEGEEDDEVGHVSLGRAAPATETPSDEQPVMVVGVDDSDEAPPLRPTIDGGRNQDRNPPLVLRVEDSDEELPSLRQHGDEVLPRPDMPRASDSLREAYSSLEIRTPPEELEAFARGRVEALARMGQVDRAGLAGDALKLAQSALRRVMGAVPREAP